MFKEKISAFIIFIEIETKIILRHGFCEPIKYKIERLLFIFLKKNRMKVACLLYKIFVFIVRNKALNYKDFKENVFKVI